MEDEMQRSLRLRCRHRCQRPDWYGCIIEAMTKLFRVEKRKRLVRALRYLHENEVRHLLVVGVREPFRVATNLGHGWDVPATPNIPMEFGCSLNPVGQTLHLPAADLLSIATLSSRGI